MAGATTVVIKGYKCDAYDGYMSDLCVSGGFGSMGNGHEGTGGGAGIPKGPPPGTPTAPAANTLPGKTEDDSKTCPATSPPPGADDGRKVHGKTKHAYLWAYRSNTLDDGPSMVAFDYQASHKTSYLRQQQDRLVATVRKLYTAPSVNGRWAGWWLTSRQLRTPQKSPWTVTVQGLF